MRKWITLFMLVCVIGCTTRTLDAGDKPVRFYNLSGQDQELIDQSAKFLMRHTQMQVDNTEIDVKQEASNKAQSAALKGKITKPAIAHIVFINAGPNEREHLHLAAQQHLAVVNLAGIRTKDAKTYGRRIDRQVMRGVFFLLGRSPCPNPYCALYDYKDSATLDQIGRNTCPPCLIGGVDSAKKKGAIIVKTPLQLKLDEKRKNSPIPATSRASKEPEGKFQILRFGVDDDSPAAPKAPEKKAPEKKAE